GVVIILPGIVIGGGPGGFGGGVCAPPAANGTQAAVTPTAPLIRTTRNPHGSTSLDYLFNSPSGRSPGPLAPPEFLIQSPQAIKIPPHVRVYQNNRNAEDRGRVVPAPVNISNSEGLIEMLADSTRQRIYVTNYGLNRVEVFDMKSQAFMTPIKVGQLPHSMAF